jgi:hypothetical protein
LPAAGAPRPRPLGPVGRRQGSRRPSLLPPQGPRGRPQQVEVVVLLSHRSLPQGGAGGVDAGQALAQAGAGVAGDQRQRRLLPQLLGPGVAVATRRPPADHPGEAVELHGHQHGGAADEQLIDGGVADPRAAVGVENRQGGGGAAGRRLGPPSQPGDAGGAGPQQDDQQAPDLGQADALGLGDAGELGLPVGVEDDGLGELPPEGVGLVPQLLHLLLEFTLAALLVVPFGGAGDLVGFAVKGLAADGTLAGEASDIAVATGEDGAGTGEAAAGGYAVQGVNSCG